MKKLVAFLGVLLGLVSVVLFFLIISDFISDEDPEYRTPLSLYLFINCCLSLFLILNKFGFNYKQEIKAQDAILIKLFAIATLFISLIIPANYFISNQLIKIKYEKPMVLPQYIYHYRMFDSRNLQNPEVKCNLMMKYIDDQVYNKVEFLLNMKDEKSLDSELADIKIEFYDKDGFIISQYSRNKEQLNIQYNKGVGFNEELIIVQFANSNMPLEMYKRIANWSIEFSLNRPTIKLGAFARENEKPKPQIQRIKPISFN